MIRLALLGSTRGTNLPVIADAIQQKQLNAVIEIVISNKQDAQILQRAADHGLRAQFLDPINLSREAYDQQVSALLRQHAVELIVLVGYMRILSDEFVTEWQNKIINVHPSLLPAHAGKMDMDVHRAVLEAGEKETGCTVHYVTAEVDAGPIILQRRCMVMPADTPESLKARVQAHEGDALVDAIASLAGK